MFFRWLVGLLFSLLLCGFSFAEFTVSGTVKDESGKAMSLANVVCKGTTNGTSTDDDGHFRFKSDKSQCLLYIGFVGYEEHHSDVERTKAGEKNIYITLKEQANLDEIVVGGCKDGVKIYSTIEKYGCVKKITCEPGQKRERIKKDFVDPDGGEPYSRTVGQQCTGKINAEDPTHVDHGLKCDLTRTMHGTCGMDFYNMLNIRQSDTETTPTEFVQDFVLTATTFVGTVLTFALVVSGLMIIFGGANENTASRGRQGIKYALIGYVIVLCSYAVIRLVQYLAAG